MLTVWARMGNMGRDRHDEPFLQYALSNAAATFYAGRNDREGSAVLAACKFLERFTQQPRALRRPGRNVAPGRTVMNVSRGRRDIDWGDRANWIIWESGISNYTRLIALARWKTEIHAREYLKRNRAYDLTRARTGWTSEGSYTRISKTFCMEVGRSLIGRLRAIFGISSAIEKFNLQSYFCHFHCSQYMRIYITLNNWKLT